MRNTILSLFVACGLLLVGPAADAENKGQGVDGVCTALGVRFEGASIQVHQGINVVNNCNAIIEGVTAFMDAGCVAGVGGIARSTEHGSCNVGAFSCDAIFTCFNIVPEFCVDVDECTNP